MLGIGLNIVRTAARAMVAIATGGAPAGDALYKQPDAASNYLQPDGTSYYLQP